MSALSIKARLYLNLAILAVALFVVCGVGMRAFNRATDRIESLYSESLVPIARVGEVFQRSLQSQQLRLEAYVHRDPRFTQENYDGVKANRERINELLQQFEQVDLPAEERRLAQEVKEERASIVDAGKQEIDALLAQDYDAATKTRIQGIEPALDRMDATTQELIAARIAAAAKVIETARQEAATNRTILLTSFFLALAISVWFAWLLARHVSRGLARAEHMATRVSRGELGHGIDVQGNDEISRLLQALKVMDTRLVETVSHVRNSATTVDLAASQLSQGSDDLSQRTQEQAAALEETAASMEEMTSTVKQNADNAMQANQIATGTRGQADQGGQVVKRAVSAMEGISSASKRIEDIISVIDEIAFQTNLLALNAAVEAARAGEQGRGFAVVASEVRNLAQRSASAAKEIKDLIGDSVEKVRAGAALVSESGETLNTIVTGVKRVTDIVAEMTAATSEQSSGIDQINLAITNMDHATQQNAALVEESAAAAKAMQQQAQELLRLVAFFRIEGESSAPVGVAKEFPQPTPASVTRLTRRSATSVRKPQPASAAMPRARASGDDSSWREF
ncbi:methyl-accepting chemotaxis protein [Povalibacter sp.]|uniref:methyl-accepting chemotaxis protein n=1 Tax=Povalibacter sp. TaxID=1962978 RepID=UPI002F40454A